MLTDRAPLMSDSGSESAREGGAPPPQQQEVSQVELAEAQLVLAFVRKTVAVLMEDTTGGPDSSHMPALDSSIRDPTTVELVKKFVADPQSPVLLIERTVVGKGQLRNRSVKLFRHLIIILPAC